MQSLITTRAAQILQEEDTTQERLSVDRISLMALLLTMFLGMHAQTGMRMLITYFSWSGSTKNLAEKIQRQPDADIYRIEPLVPYTDDYQELAYQIYNKEKMANN